MGLRDRVICLLMLQVFVTGTASEMSLSTIYQINTKLSNQFMNNR